MNLRKYNLRECIGLLIIAMPLATGWAGKLQNDSFETILREELHANPVIACEMKNARLRGHY